MTEITFFVWKMQMDVVKDNLMNFIATLMKDDEMDW